MNIKQAKFNIGQIIRHSESGYRGVIVDIDPEFTRYEMYVKPVQVPQIEKAEPWYHVLLEDQNLQAYIAERQLQHDTLGMPIDHAFVNDYFTEFEHDHYVLRRSLN